MSFNIGAKNGLLDAKHMEAMGNSIWLYLWFLDKQPRNTDKVLRGVPITYEIVSASFKGLSRRTYARWLSTLIDNKYISVLRTPRGMVISIVKSKKWIQGVELKSQQQSLDFGSTDTPELAHHNKESDTPNVAQQKVRVIRHFGNSDVPKRVERYAQSGTSNIRYTSSSTNINNGKTSLPMQSDTTNDAKKELISKLYYDIIKSYELPVMNHTHVQKKIKELGRSTDLDKVVKYLEFMLNDFRKVTFKYKPHISKALDIYDKRIQIEENIKAHVQENNDKKAKVGKIR